MKEFKGQLIERIKRTSSVESFRFLTSEKIEFIPGEFLQVVFDEKNWNNPTLNKYLSFSSSPTKDYFEITKRLSESEFSRNLKNLSIGQQVTFNGPIGQCVFREEFSKIAFLIGGIGITPVISIIEYIADNKLPNDVILLYSNRTEDEIAFKEELDNWQGNPSNFKVVYTATDAPAKNPACLFGRIDKKLVWGKIPDFLSRKFFIFGPPKMVESMADLCLEIRCREENILSEKFIGY